MQLKSVILMYYAVIMLLCKSERVESATMLKKISLTSSKYKRVYYFHII